MSNSSGNEAHGCAIEWLESDIEFVVITGVQLTVQFGPQ